MDLPMEQQIAIVGIGCRFGGGVDSVGKFWDMLSQGLDCTTTPPPDRFDCSHYMSPGDKLPGKIYSQRGGFLQQDPYMFDRKFFKIPPDEADHMDPQVRLLLEVTWEALEDSGISASSMRGSKTGVYMGVTASEYAILSSMPSHNINQYTNSGTNSCMMANRVSYEFDFCGPSFSLDTACSSSLYAIHMACDALKNGSCPMAVAGGVNLILMTGATVGFCQAGMLSPDGRCKSFDESANGYSRSEGAGVIVLKKLTKAIEDGDRVYSVIRGGSLSNDGRTPGIATPSLEAQVDLVKSACRNANVNPQDVAYAEAHGTGTMVGDKTEANALGQAMRGQTDDVKDPPLFIGSVKSNIGHTEGAAGVAGIIKTALSLQHKCIPRVVHFNMPNKLINIEDLHICIPKELTSWPDERQFLATCSSFGFGGANANLVLSKAPSVKSDIGNITVDIWKPRPLLLSAASKGALQQRLRDWEKFLQSIPKTDQKLYLSALYTAAQRSHHHQHRMGFVVKTLNDAIHQIKGKLAGDKKVRCMEDIIAGNSNNKIVFVFSGMGTQWWGMARDLMQADEVFASTITEIDTILQGCGAKWSLLHMLTEEYDKEKVNKTDVAQPCICAVQIGLLAVWKERGLTPNVIVGHSVGEVAAAYAAGLLSLEDAVNLIYHRGKLLSRTSGTGKMVAVLHSAVEIQERLQESIYGDSLDVAAENSPNQIVLSGSNFDIDSFVSQLKRDRIKCVKLKVDNAFHSRQQEVLQKSFTERVSKFLGNEETKITKLHSNVPMMSTVTCQYLTVQEANTSDYWWNNTRNKVRFKEAIESLIIEGHGVFVEVGAHAALLTAIQDTADNLKATPGRVITTGSLKRPRDTTKLADDNTELLLSHAKLHVAGVTTTFDSYFEKTCRNVTSLPLYPWQREKCSAISDQALQLFQFPVNTHPLLGELQISFITQASAEKVWKSDLNESTVPWLKDHVIGGAVILPAAAYLEVAIAVAKEEFPDKSTIILAHVDLQKFLFATDRKAMLETTLEEEQERMLRVTIRSHDKQANKWTQHGRINIAIPHYFESTPPTRSLDIGGILERCRFPVTREEFYANESYVGLTLGSAFRSTTRAFVNADYTEILCYCDAPENVWWESKRYSFHPALLDSCFQPYAVLLFAQGREEARNLGTLHRPLKRVPRSINELCLYKNSPRKIIVHLVSVGAGTNCFCNVTVADAETSEIFCEIDAMRFDVFESEGINTEPHIWQTEWVHVPLHGELSEEAESSRKDQSDDVDKGDDDEDRVEDNTQSELDILDRKILVFPDEAGVSEIVTNVLGSFGIHIEVAGNEEDPKDVIERHYSPDGEFFTDIIVLKTLDMNGLADIPDITTPMSIEEFQRIQNPAPLFYLAIIQKLLDIPQEKRPRILVVTKGAYDVDIKADNFTRHNHVQKLQDDDTVTENGVVAENLDMIRSAEITDPFLSSIHSILITAVHEEPTLKAILLDLPLLASLEDKAQIMHSIFLHLPPDENIFACRYMTPEKELIPITDALQWNIFSPRLSFQPTSQSKVNTSNDNWRVSLDQTTGHCKIIVLPPYSQKQQANNGQVCVKVKAFRTFSYPESMQSNSSEMLTIFAGTVDNNGNANNNQSHEEPQQLSKPSCVLGIGTGNGLPSYFSVARNLITKIPEGIDCAVAVSLVSRYLPAKIILEETLCISSSTNILILGNNTSIPESALIILAGLKAAKVVVILSSAEDDYTPADKITYILPEHIEGIADSTFDMLIISEASSSLQAGQMALLLQKLKRSSSVVFLHENANTSRNMYKLPSRIKFMALDISFSMSVEGTSFCDIKKHLTELWRILVPSLSDSSEDSNTDISNVSSLSLSSGILPDTSVISMSGADFSLPISLQYETWIADDDVSYFVTGGSSGLGLYLVEWLVSRKAKHIFVLSRTELSDEAEEVFARLRLEGAIIVHFQGDVTDATKLEEVLQTICKLANTPPLAGIFHFATTYDDGFILGMSADSWNSAMSTKAYGALLLHQVTLKLGISLKYFVVASSVVSIIGNPGQANYCAANNFVNGLCKMRYRMGLPATTLIIGYLNTVGFAVRRGLITGAEENGFISVSPTDVLGALSVALKANLPELIIAGPLTLSLFASRHRALMSHHFRRKQGTLSLLKAIFDDKDSFIGQTKGSLRQMILDLPIEEARKTILTVMSNILSKQLGISSDIQEDSSPVSLGIDSLMASTLSHTINEQFEVTLGAVDFLNENNTLQSICNTILHKITRCAESYTPLQEEMMGNVLPSAPLQAPVTMVSRWVVEGPPVPSPTITIVCFPPNGGGPSTFSSWPHHLSYHGIQLLFVQMPGWEGRDNEAPLATLEEMTRCLTDALMPILADCPFVFFGHSMGSLLAFEVSHALLNHGLCPQHLFVSSWYAPTEKYPHPEELEVPGQVFHKLGEMLGVNMMKFQQIMKNENVNFSFIDDSVLNNRVLMSRMLPAVEVALKIAKIYRLIQEERLPCGITAFCGESDPFVSPDLMDDWKLQLVDERNFEKLVLPGKHMHILENTDLVLHKVKLELLQLGIELRMPQNGNSVERQSGMDGGTFEHGTVGETVKLRERKGRAQVSSVSPVYESRYRSVRKSYAFPVLFEEEDWQENL